MAGLDFLELGNFRGANVHLEWAAGVKVASRRGMDGAGYFPLEQDPLAFESWVGRRICREQSLSIGVFGLPVKVFAPGQLGNPSQVHHGHSVANMFDDGEVMGDE